MIYLTDSERRIMTALVRLTCATRLQLAYWADSSPSSTARQLQCLLGHDLVEIFKATPHIYRLSQAGCRTLGERYTKRILSFSAISNLCHRNALEIDMRNSVASAFTVLHRMDVYRRGLNPGFAEYAGTDGTLIFFCLVDDYLMGPERIKHAFNREHTPNNRHFSMQGRKLRKWRDVADRFVIATTDESRACLYQKEIKTHQLPFDVMSIEPLWKEAAW